MSNYRATKKNFLPPPKKSVIIKSKHKFTDGVNTWIFDKDIPDSEHPKRLKNWALFTSDQWDSRNLIAYVTFEKNNESMLPNLGEYITLINQENQQIFRVINRFIDKRVCRTYVLQAVN